MKCSYPKSPHILCMLCASKHSSKPAYTVLATYMHPVPTQAGAYSASCVHASTHSTLRILCKLCTCIHPLNPAHTLQAVYMHPPTQASAYSASRAHSDPACKPACKSACELCMKSLQVQAETCMRMQNMHAEGVACRVCM